MQLNDLVTKTVEIWENERYSPLNFSFSSSNLLPTDRSRYSAKDGSLNFISENDLSKSLISAGWSWVDDSSWSAVIIYPRNSNGSNSNDNSNVCDDNGTSSSSKEDEVTTPKAAAADDNSSSAWTYAVDFPNFNDTDILYKKNMSSFVRRRKLTRTMSYNPASLLTDKGVNLTCKYCDLKQICSTSSLLLKSMTSWSLLKHPRHIDMLKVNVLKNILLDQLVSTSNVIDITNNSYDMDKFEVLLHGITSKGKDVGSMVSSLFVSDDVATTFKMRMTIIADNFDIHERDLLSKLLIRLYDSHCMYHCPILDCSEDTCIFKPEACCNEYCQEIYSKKYRNEHDATCIYKLVPCDRECGENVARRYLSDHIDGPCPLRVVTCPFCSFGCNVEIVQKDLPVHLDTAVSEHMLQVGHCMMKQQANVKTIIANVTELHEKYDSHSFQLKATQSSVGVAMALIETQRERYIKDLSDQIHMLDVKYSKKVNDLPNNTEISKLTSEVLKLNNELKIVKQQLAQATTNKKP